MINSNLLSKYKKEKIKCSDLNKGGKAMQIETRDLWQSAYVLCEGGTLEEVRVRKKEGGQKEVVFVLNGAKVEMLAKEFDSGQAFCNITKLKANLNHLKDVIFRRQ